MNYNTGASKSLDDITLEDVLRYPIWEWALDEEDNECQDETWQRPLVDSMNVTDKMIDPTITVRIKGAKFYGSAHYDHKSASLNSICVWYENQWQEISKTDLPMPVVLISIPTINGRSNVEFVFVDIHGDEAKEIKW